MRVLVIGGGIFGSNVAIELEKAKFDVTLIEKESKLMQHASKNNHNRLHLGYHYLRSTNTAKQSIEGLLSFLFYYGESVLHSFPNYYAIAKEGSFTNSNGFIKFCDEVGIDYDEEFPNDSLLNKEFVENCFKVPEPIFDYSILSRTIEKRLEESSVKVRLNTVCLSLERKKDTYFAKINNLTEQFDVVINATYASINFLNQTLSAPTKKIKYQDVVIPNFEYNHTPIGLTIMDGPFCSVMPKGKDKNKFLLYHVTDSVIQSEIKEQLPEFRNDLFLIDNIIENSRKFYPFLNKVKILNNYRTIRAVHENDQDARVTELQEYKEFPNYFTILSGKITTCVQVSLKIKHKLQNKNKSKLKII